MAKRSWVFGIAAGLSTIGGGAALAGSVTVTPYTGVVVFNLPSVTLGSVVDSSGPLDLTGYPTGVGAVLGINLNVDLGSSFRIEGDASIASVSGFASVTPHPTGFAYYEVSSPVSSDTFNSSTALSENLTTGVNTITTTQTSTGTGGSAIVSQGTTNSVTVSQSNSTNGQVVDQTTDTPTSAAAGQFVATATGFVGFGLGDLSSSIAGQPAFAFTNNYSDNVVDANFEVHGAIDVPVGTGTFSPFIGPLFKQINQTISIDTVFSGAGFDQLALTMSGGSEQHLIFNTSEHLVGNYWGALFGADFTAPLANGMSFKLGIAGAPMYANVDYHALGTVNLAPDTMSTLDESEGTFAVFARGKASISKPWGRGTFTLGANVEYLSRIATVVQGPPQGVTTTAYTPTGNTPNGTMTGSGNFGPNQSLGYTSMTAYGLTAGYMLPF